MLTNVSGEWQGRCPWSKIDSTVDAVLLLCFARISLVWMQAGSDGRGMQRGEDGAAQRRHDAERSCVRGQKGKAMSRQMEVLGWLVLILLGMTDVNADRGCTGARSKRMQELDGNGATMEGRVPETLC